ncbi:MAG TPA: addiction module protein [Kiritimatiellia bacterium]|mgnify:CR=1 FL=1|nr:addiction module protein [Kiritimatiellia bacterium]
MDLSVLENEALKLSHADRAVLADHLMASVTFSDANIMKAWAVEGEQRLAMFRKGKLSARDGESVIASLREKLG